MLQEGAAPDSRNPLGKTVLLMACEKGNQAMADLMLQAGAYVNPGVARRRHAADGRELRRAP